MALHGELKNMPLPDILQSLKANRQSGTLNLQDGKKEFGLFFEKDSVTCVNPGRSTREYFPQILCLFLNISEETMEREFKKKIKLNIAQRLHKSRIAGVDKINTLHRVYLTEALYDAFMWQSGSFRFEDGTSPGPMFDDDQRNAGLKLDIDQVLFESMRRTDEWTQIAKHIPTMDDVFTINDEFRPQIEQSAEPEKSIFQFCNGENNVREIAYRSGQDFFTTAKILGIALENSAARRIAPNDLIALAEKSFTNNRRNEALRYFKRAIELDRGNIDVRRRFADLCVQMEMNHEATNEYKTIAQLAREKRDYERAKTLYRQIIAMNPSEYEFQKRLYEMLHEINDPEAKTTGLELADTLKRLGMRKEEVQILRQLIEDHKDDVPCIERLGDAEQSLGHEKSATENYYTAAELSAQRNDVQSACLNYQKILAINSDDTKAWKMLDELQSGLYLEKRRRRKKIVRSIECGIVLAVISLYLAYLAISVIDYLDMRNSSLHYLAESDFTPLRTAVSVFGKKYPLSLINLDLPRYRREIEKLGNADRSANKPAIADTLHSAGLPDSTFQQPENWLSGPEDTLDEPVDSIWDSTPGTVNP